MNPSESTSTDTGVKHCAKHPDVETRLSCSACDTPICPKCMVMCDVGIKCPACVNKTTSHLAQVGPKHLTIAGMLGLVAGTVFSNFYMFIGALPFRPFGIPVLSFIVAYALGRGMGGAISKLSGRKMGATIALVVTITTIVGVLIGPFNMVLAMFFEILANSHNMAGNTGTSASLFGFSFLIELALVYVFIHGLRGALLFK